ncbi:hypothetical protein EVAR_64958_1 [Eumeta japonica]|uniref:THAP-type domain-containing protein n=1 Tax=Eumeta variegata TaxID=151549 RepID=A0A4C1ZN68_EUMVA|nr:hypothetical protein EVAR_64958_1 [Eumeta japonica]
MDRKTYRWCAVPQYENTSTVSPQKVFIVVLCKYDARRKWLQLAGKGDVLQIAINSTIFICEDYFDFTRLRLRENLFVYEGTHFAADFILSNIKERDQNLPVTRNLIFLASVRALPAPTQKIVLFISTLDNKPWQPSTNTRICSAHFVGGKQSDVENSPSYVPTIFPPVYKKKGKSQLDSARHERLLKRKERMTTSTASKPQENDDIVSNIVMEYHIMGKVSRVRMKQGCVPKKFECQEDRRKRTCSYKERLYMLKKQRMSVIAECLNEPEQSSTPSASVQDTSNTSSVGENVPETPETLCVLTANKSVQALITAKFRSKAVQTTITSTEKALSPLKPSKVSTSTSPFKSETIINLSPSMSGLSKITRNMSDEAAQSDSDNSLFVPSTSTTSCSPVHSLQVKSSSDCSEFIEEDKKVEAKETMLNGTGLLIKKLRDNLIVATIITGSAARQLAHILQIPMIPTDLPISFK